MQIIALALALIAPLATFREDPRTPGPAPALAVSAFQAAQHFLAQLDAQDPKSERFALDRLDAKRAAADKDHVERVICEADVSFVGQDTYASSAALASMMKALTEAKTTLSSDTVKLDSPAGTRAVRIRFEYDPSKAPAPATTPRTRDEDPVNAQSFVRKCASQDKVELGDLELVPSAPELRAGTWMQESFAIAPHEKQRVLWRHQITNFATVLERDHAHASVTALTLTAVPATSNAHAGYTMRVEVALLRPATTEEIATAEKR